MGCKCSTSVDGSGIKVSFSRTINSGIDEGTESNDQVGYLSLKDASDVDYYNKIISSISNNGIKGVSLPTQGLNGELACAGEACCGTQELVRSLTVGEGTAPKPTRMICGCACTGNMQVLALSASLFATITCAQTCGALISHSESLLADCISMAVDAVTYILNLFAESLEGTRYHDCATIVIPLMSISSLVYFTSGVVQEALAKLSGVDDGDDDVNPYIVLGFSCWCLVFDSISICAFARNLRNSRESASQINMLAAFTHVSADFARSLTELIESVLIMVFQWDSVKTDAWACLIVSSTIMLGVALALCSWCKTIFQVMQVRPDTLERFAQVDLGQRGLSWRTLPQHVAYHEINRSQQRSSHLMRAARL